MQNIQYFIFINDYKNDFIYYFLLNLYNLDF